jgi:LysM repeat protein
MYCRRCGTLLPQGVVICPECGARQRRQASSVRCANCRGRVPIGLTVCPHCGRDVRPAGPRWGLWLAGLVALILFGLWGLGKLPLEQAGQEIARVRSKLTSLVQVLGPVIRPMQPLETPQVVGLLTRVPTPTETTPEVPPASEATVLPDEAAPIDETPPGEAPTVEPTVVMSVTVTATGAIAITGTVAATGTIAATGTPPPTATATAIPTTEPTSTPVQVPTQAPTAVPPSPTPTATKAAAAQATPASGKQTTYVIQSGDTLSVIADRFNVSLDALLAANQLTAKSVLRIGQQLIIPVSGAPIPPTATPRPKPTTAPPTATPAPLLAAPVLTGPGDQASYTGDRREIYLIWEPVPGMVAGNQYLVCIRWMEGGTPQENCPPPTTATTIQAPPWLWSRADPPARQYTWFVRLIHLATDGKGGELLLPLSPASQIRTFYWN